MSVQIRRLGDGDEALARQTVLAVKPEEELAGQAPSLPHLRRFLALPTNYLVVAVDGEAPAAFLTAYQMPDVASDADMVYLFEIEVLPTYRRQGIGTGLVNTLLRLCRQAGVAEVWVGTDNANAAARRLYERTGAVLDSSDNCEFKYALQP